MLLLLGGSEEPPIRTAVGERDFGHALGDAIQVLGSGSLEDLSGGQTGMAEVGGDGGGSTVGVPVATEGGEVGGSEDLLLRGWGLGTATVHELGGSVTVGFAVELAIWAVIVALGRRELAETAVAVHGARRIGFLGN